MHLSTHNESRCAVFIVWLGPALDSSKGVILKEIGFIKAVSVLKTKFVVIRYSK